MSVVRFSENLLDEIKTNSNKTFDARIKKAKDISPDIGQKMYDHAFKDHSAIMASLPREFFNVVNKIRLIKIGDISVDEFLVLHRDCPLPEGYPAFYKLRNINHYDSSVVCYFPSPTDAVDCELVEYFSRRREQITAVTKQCEEFTNGVMKVCEAFTTLAPALKAWPPLWDLLPDEAKNRHLEVKDRASKVKSDLASVVNLESMTATVVATKLVR